MSGAVLAAVLCAALLMASYREGDISHAYPVMRGCAPLIVALLGQPFTGERLAAMQWLAIGLVCGGVLTMVAGVRGTNARRTTLLALATACVIAAYTLVDGVGVRRSGEAVASTLWVFLVTAIGVLLLARRRCACPRTSPPPSPSASPPPGSWPVAAPVRAPLPGSCRST